MRERSPIRRPESRFHGTVFLQFRNTGKKLELFGRKKSKTAVNSLEIPFNTLLDSIDTQQWFHYYHHMLGNDCG